MVDLELLELPADSTLNIEGKPNVPLCPMCAEILGPTPEGDQYMYKKTNPDTRWFWCPACECHLGYHRMKMKWKVDPYDLNTNNKLRGYFGLPLVKEE